MQRYTVIADTCRMIHKSIQNTINKLGLEILVIISPMHHSNESCDFTLMPRSLGQQEMCVEILN